MNQEIELDESDLITIQFVNDVQVNFFEGLRTDLTQFLRQKLKNNNINIESKVIQGESKQMLYTPKEKFNYLAEKYPDLKTLKDKLGLDTDF